MNLQCIWKWLPCRWDYNLLWQVEGGSRDEESERKRKFRGTLSNVYSEPSHSMAYLYWMWSCVCRDWKTSQLVRKGCIISSKNNVDSHKGHLSLSEVNKMSTSHELCRDMTWPTEKENSRIYGCVQSLRALLHFFEECYAYNKDHVTYAFCGVRLNGNQIHCSWGFENFFHTRVALHQHILQKPSFNTQMKKSLDFHH